MNRATRVSVPRLWRLPRGLHSHCSTIVLAEREHSVRPQLNSAMSQSVICARVALQLTKLYYQHGQDYQLSPASSASRAAEHLPLDGFGMLRFALHSLAVYLNLGWPGVEWLSEVLEASHFGSSFRRCFFFDYKENRRPYPRVTNRGVQNSTKQTTFGSRRAKSNEPT